MEEGTNPHVIFYMTEKKIGKNTYKIDWQLTTNSKNFTESDELILHCMYYLMYGKQIYCVEG